MGTDVAGQCLGERGARGRIQRLGPGTQFRIGQPDHRIVAHRLDPAGDAQAGARQQRDKLRHGEGAIARVQQQVVQAGIAAAHVVVDVAVRPQPVGLRQVAHHPARHVEPRRRLLPGRGQQAQRVLHHVDAGAPVRRIDHQPEPAAGRQHRGQRAQPLGRVGQVMQHAAAIDVVERSQPGAGKIKQRAGLPKNISQPADRGAGLGQLQRAGGAVEPGHRPGAPRGRQLLRQHQCAVAGPAAGDQRVQRLGGRAARAKNPVVDLAQVSRAAHHQPARLVPRVALRVGECLVLRRKLRVGCVGHARGIDRRRDRGQMMRPGGGGDIPAAQT